jgi:hypothetical protein
LDLIQTFEPKSKTEEENMQLNNNDVNNMKAILDRNSEKKTGREISEVETIQST